MSIQALREQRAAIGKQLNDLVNSGKPWDAARDQPVYDAGIAEVESIDAQIKRIETINAFAVENAERNGVIEAAERVGHDKNSPGANLFAKFLRSGKDSFSAEERIQVQNAMSTGVGAEGGFTVPTEIASAVLDAMKKFGGMRDAADVVRTADGAPMNWPTSDGTNEEGEVVAENALTTTQDVAFGTLALPVYRYSSKSMPVPLELLQDSSIDIEAFVMNRLMQRLGRITNRHFTSGTGVSQPNGVITAAAIGKTAATGGTVTATYGDFLDLVHSVDPAYREGGECSFMMNDLSLRNSKKIVDLEARPIFLPAYDLNASGGLDRILGYPVRINQSVPDMAANARSIAFGDFKKYIIRDAMDVIMLRLTDSAFSLRGQIGFCAFLRSGGNLMDVGGAVKVFRNSAT
jgi:HK97 family phage major capsid protein